MKSDSIYTSVTRNGDKIMFVTLCLSTLVVLAVGITYTSSTVITSAVYMGTFVVGALILLYRSPSLTSSLTLTVCNAVVVTLHIHLSRGQLEYHFGIFALLGLLLVYRDWRPLVLAAFVLGCNQLIFGHLQVLYGIADQVPTVDLTSSVLQISYLVVQTGIEILLASKMKQNLDMTSEICDVVYHMNSGTGTNINLNVSNFDPESEVAQTLHRMVGQIDHAVTGVMDRTDAVLQTLGVLTDTGNGILRDTGEKLALCSESVRVVRSLLATVVEGQANLANSSLELNNLADNVALGQSAMDQVSVILGDIQNSGAQLESTTDVLDDVSFQANLLALNQSLNAAHSKGPDSFHAVTREIKVLAQGIARSSADIRQQVADSHRKIAEGHLLVGQAAKSMAHILKVNQKITATMKDVSAVSSLLTVELTELRLTLEKLFYVVGPNNKLIAHAIKAISIVKSQVTDLQHAMDTFE